MAADAAPRRRLDVRLALCALPAFALLVGLGFWQLQRLEWKEGLIAERAARLAAPAVAIGEIRDWRSLERRRVSARGRYLHDRGMRVVNRLRRGRPGHGLVTPLALPDGSAVLVDRGWMPPDAAPRPEPAGEVFVVGLLRAGGRSNAWQPRNDPARGEWFFVDAPRMAEAAGLDDAKPFHLQLLPAAGRTGYPEPGGPGAALPNRHLGYALTWFGLAAALAGVFAVHQMRRR